MGYEPSDQVRVVFPFEAKRKKLVRDGMIVARVGDDRFRVVFEPPMDVDGCEIEQAIVHQKHFV